MDNARISIGLLFGGASPEHEVSIVSARSIAAHLDPERYEVRPMGIARNGVWVLNGDPFARLSAGELPGRGDCPFLPLERGAETAQLPDVFFNAIHGAGGEDGQIQGFLEPLQRPYTGAGLLAMAAGLDKWITKRIWASEGLPVVPYVGLTEEGWRRDPAKVLQEVARLGLPLFVKPANLGSSIGIEKVGRKVGEVGERAALHLALFAIALAQQHRGLASAVGHLGDVHVFVIDRSAGMSIENRPTPPSMTTFSAPISPKVI